MNTWPNGGAPGGPCEGLDDNETEQSRVVRSSWSDSSQHASSKPGAVQMRRVSSRSALRAPTLNLRSSPPQKSPLPGTAWRSGHRCGSRCVPLQQVQFASVVDDLRVD